jgi:hypothetical protein
MNKQEARQLQADIRDALAPVMERHGLRLKPATIRFDDLGFTMSLKGEDPNAEIPDWHLESVGLPKGTKPGVEFTYGRERYRFDGIAINRPKYPINATRLKDDRQYKLGRSAADSIAKEVTE